MDDINKILYCTRNTLDDVDVRGIENMKKVICCFEAIETVMGKLKNIDAASIAGNEEDSHG